MSKSKKTIMTIIIIILVLCFFVAMYFILQGNYQEKVELGKDKISTLSTIIGQKKSSKSFTENTEKKIKKEFVYDTGSIEQNEIDEYMIYLQKQGFVKENSLSANSSRFYKQAAEEEKTITVEINFIQSGITVITYMKQ